MPVGEEAFLPLRLGAGWLRGRGAGSDGKAGGSALSQGDGMGWGGGVLGFLKGRIQRPVSTELEVEEFINEAGGGGGGRRGLLPHRQRDRCWCGAESVGERWDEL